MSQINVVRKDKVIIDIFLDAELFKEQRLLLDRIIEPNYDFELMTHWELKLLRGIQALLDEIADQARDNYRMDTLISEDE